MGRARICVCCGHQSAHFLPIGDFEYNRREDALCAWCGSLERHRLLVHFLDRELPPNGARTKVLHFAPERCLEEYFSVASRWDYLSADLYQPAMAKEDITGLSFPDDTFDLIICSHVLDHVPDDIKAMQELGRVLRPRGMALILSLVDPDLPVTRQGPPPDAPVRPVGNESIRLYGRDFAERLESGGLRVQVVDEAQALSAADRVRYGVGPKANPKLREQNKIYVCRKT